MNLSQRFIDLLNLPKRILEQLAEQHGDIPMGDAHDRWSIASRLASELDRDAIEEGSGGLLYAGRTSVSWLRLVPPGIEGDDEEGPGDQGNPRVDQEAFQEALEAMYPDRDPFDEDDRPEVVTPAPVLVFAQERDAARFNLTFAVQRRLTTVIHNFEAKDVLADEFFLALIDLQTGTIEVRASAAKVKKFAKTWLLELANQLDLAVASVAITEQDFEALKAELGAQLDSFRGKPSDGGAIYSTIELTKSPAVADLLEEDDFNDQVENHEAIRYGVKFQSDDIEGDIHLYVSTLQGSINFLTAVPESVIDYVYKTLMEVQGAG